MRHRIISKSKQVEQVFTAKINIPDEQLIDLIQIYPLKDIKRYINIPSSILPILIEKECTRTIKTIPMTLAIAKLQVGMLPSELSKYNIENERALNLIHLKLNEVKPNMEEQVYCSDKKTHQLKWLIKRNTLFQLDVLANEVRGIFQNNNNLRQHCYQG